MSRSARTLGAARRGSNEPGISAALKRPFDALDGAEVRWCLLRGRDELSDGGDVDLLVSGDDIERARTALEAVGFLEQRSWGYRPHRFFLRAGDEGWTKIDIVTELRFGPAGTARVKGLDGAMERRRREGPLWRLDPPDEFWALLLHALLDKPSVEDRHRRALRRLVPAALNSPAAVGLFRSRAGAETIVDAVEHDRWAQPAAWARSLTPRGPAAALTGTRRAIGRRIGWRLSPLHRPGVTVALLAPDGAGKTTVANLLGRTSPFPVRTIYMGLYKNPGRRLPPGVGLAARLGLQWTRYARAVYHRRRGRVVLFDRYTYDSDTSSASPSGARDRIRRRVLASALPRPDLILVLDAPAEELLRRKGEHDLARLERDRAHYRAVAERTSSSAIIDATRPPDEVVRAAAARIWTALVARS